MRKFAIVRYNRNDYIDKEAELTEEEIKIIIDELEDKGRRKIPKKLKKVIE